MFSSRCFGFGVTALAALSLLAAHPAAAQTTVYHNDFTAGAGSEWSNNATDTTPGTAAHAADKFLGQFGNQTTTLTLDGLAAHSQVSVNFDLYIINTMDGNGPFGGGADPWLLTENGKTLIATNFANYPGNTQDFGGSDGAGGYLTGGSYAAYTGSSETQTLGYTQTGGDSVYHFSFTFADASPTLALNFIGQQNQGIGDESWGLDNVAVTTDAVAGAPVPETSTTASFSALFVLGLSGVAVSRRRRGTTA